MTPGILMIIGAVTFAFGMLMIILSFKSMAKSIQKSFSGGDIDDMFDKMPSRMTNHLLYGEVAGIGGLSLLAGFIWFLVSLFVK